MTDRTPTVDPIHLVRDIAARAALAVGLVGIGLVHLLDSIGKYGETRYLFWMYIALIAGSLAAAGAVLFERSRLTFLAAAGLAACAAIGFVLSRTTGLPHATDDIGNWTEPLGLASLFIEGSVIALGLGAYAATAARQPARIRGLVVAPA
jgi:pimeloyl-ACP methyl ester carboxylesterase